MTLSVLIDAAAAPSTTESKRQSMPLVSCSPHLPSVNGSRVLFCYFLQRKEGLLADDHC